ncbi:MAG: 50S ribosomal protein L9 [Armatimonadota bacterium]
MRVILLEDVPRVGHEGDVISVADGYMRNYLEPRGLAVRATKGALRDLESRRDAIDRRDEQKRLRAQQRVEELRDKRIVVHAPTGEGGRLHGTVTTGQIAQAAEEQLGLVIDRRDIDIPEPIREIGDYLITAKVYKNVEAQLPVRVVSLTGEERRVEERFEEYVVEEEAAEQPVEEHAEAVEELREADGQEA